jgi:hypothetical protein
LVLVVQEELLEIQELGIAVLIPYFQQSPQRVAAMEHQAQKRLELVVLVAAALLTTPHII